MGKIPGLNSPESISIDYDICFKFIAYSTQKTMPMKPLTAPMSTPMKLAAPKTRKGATTVIPVLSMFYWETSSAYTMSRFDPPNGVGYYDIPHDYHISLLTSFMDNPFSIFATRLKHGLLSNLVPQSHDLMSQHQVFFSEARTILYIIVFACFSLVSNKLIKFMRISDQK
jgi:hypothetical protein